MLGTYIGMISPMYTHEIEPKEKEKIIDTRKIKKTPAIERPCFVPSVFWLLMAPSQINASVIPIVPKRSGFRRPTRSRRKTMKMRSEAVVNKHLGYGSGFEALT